MSIRQSVKNKKAKDSNGPAMRRELPEGVNPCWECESIEKVRARCYANVLWEIYCLGGCGSSSGSEFGSEKAVEVWNVRNPQKV